MYLTYTYHEEGKKPIMNPTQQHFISLNIGSEREKDKENDGRVTY